MTVESGSKRVVVAGATGYLGRHLVEELRSRGHHVVAILRPGKVVDISGVESFHAQVTDAASLRGVCDGADAVFSALGITRQRDDVTYEDIEYHANLNLLREAERSGVPRFGVISAIHPEHFRELAIMKSRERFVAALRDSNIEARIIRATGFFSDLEQVFEMARRGRVYLLGDGSTRSNPIHGRDLAVVCADEWLETHAGPVHADNKEVEVGGPDTLSWREVADLAFAALSARPKVTLVPFWLPRLLLPLLRVFDRRSFDVGQFIVHGAAIDMTAPENGSHHLASFYAELAASAEEGKGRADTRAPGVARTPPTGTAEGAAPSSQNSGPV